MRDERGSGTLLWVAVLAAALVVTAALTVVLAHVTVAHRLRMVADVVAVHAARAPADQSCQVAQQAAEANDVVLEACQRVGDEVDFVVTVTVSRTTRWLTGTQQIEVTSHAGQA